VIVKYGCATRQSQPRLLNGHRSRSGGRSQGRFSRRAAREPLTASRRGGYRTLLITRHRATLLCVRSSTDFYKLLVIPGAGGPYLPSALIESRMSPDIPVLRWVCRDDALARGNYALSKDAQDWIEDTLQPHLERLPDIESYFGMDFGRSGDLSVIWPLQMQQSTARHTPFVIELRNVPYKQQEQIPGNRALYRVDEAGRKGQRCHRHSHRDRSTKPPWRGRCAAMRVHQNETDT
jgi:hypothetical protein